MVIAKRRFVKTKNSVSFDKRGLKWTILKDTREIDVSEQLNEVIEHKLDFCCSVHKG